MLICEHQARYTLVMVIWLCYEVKHLSNAVKKIINTENSKSGIYNLASLNSTAEEIAYAVSEIMNVPVKEYLPNELEKITNTKLQTTAYNFAISSNKFERNFNFKFQENIKTIVDSILTKFDDCKKTNRNESKIYG